MGTGVLPRDVTGGNFTIKLVAGVFGLTLLDFSGDLCKSYHKPTLYDLMAITYPGLPCPLKAGDTKVHVAVGTNLLIPKLIAETTTTLLAHANDGTKLFCLEVSTVGGKAQGKARRVKISWCRTEEPVR